MPARRWEYKLVSTNDLPGRGIFDIKSREAVEAYLNQLGDDGWEIVSVDFNDPHSSPADFQALARRER